MGHFFHLCVCPRISKDAQPPTGPRLFVTGVVCDVCICPKKKMGVIKKKLKYQKKKKKILQSE
jgi:hypothetical protein